MVRLARDRAHGDRDVRQAGRFATDFELTLGQLVLLAETAQILDHHLGWQVRPVPVPIEQIKRGRRFPHHVAADRGAIDQVV